MNWVSYPSILHFAKDGITVTFPDLPGCITCGSNDTDAISMAKEALGLHLYGLEMDGEKYPNPSPFSKIKTEENEVVCLIDIPMHAFRDEYRRKSIKKTLTIPAWLNEVAEEKNINFSQVLQDALKDKLGLNIFKAQ
ncbi:type II toxin-antitoxin system HicB family antitoxin [Bacillus amyloliquefaciens]|uniref:type II toxin-antitoxin system HicB family antitoxin n=1 Tax=Bacillus amyloliquefaciens TaxID=1390 RepID=UPI001CA45225|nr:type II toxin-antitoxin system HicB family antitoxin [Bacillus amyloliquefaciens]MCP1459589.1 putative RNase H-like HicB family nuclease [Bacillus amyloliquefaciens]QZY34553.1 type II toxin-antitoxin system HicB family antitoxin [Bacillus amyloliquefaciens]